MFGVGYKTCMRTYALHCVAVSRFSKVMMPVPTYAECFADTPTLSRALLKIGKEDAVIVGDCTERRILDTKNNDLHNAFRSQYKAAQTVKALVRTTGSSYITAVEQLGAGAISDDNIHNLFDVAGKLKAMSPDGLVVYNYDRGLVDMTAFLRHGIRVIQAETKAPNQRVFSEESAAKSRQTSSSRIHVERNMEELRGYVAFGSTIPLAQIDLADAELECGRWLCNLKPRLHNWTERSRDGGTGSTISAPPTQDTAADASGLLG